MRVFGVDAYMWQYDSEKESRTAYEAACRTVSSDEYQGVSITRSASPDLKHYFIIAFGESLESDVVPFGTEVPVDRNILTVLMQRRMAREMELAESGHTGRFSDHQHHVGGKGVSVPIDYPDDYLARGDYDEYH